MERMAKAAAEIIPEKSPVTNILVSALVVLYMAGLMIFHVVGNFDYDPVWDKIYYLWDNSKDLLFWIILLSLKKELAVVLFLVTIYAFIRLCLEVITVITGTGPNAWYAIDILFLALLAIIVFLSIIQRLRK
jgi:hypothetical protein